MAGQMSIPSANFSFGVFSFTKHEWGADPDPDNDPDSDTDAPQVREKFGVRRQAVFRATPLFEQGAAAMLRAKAVPRSAHSAALVTALQISRLRVFAEHCSPKSLRLVDQAAVSLEHLALVSQRRRPNIQREAALSASTG